MKLSDLARRAARLPVIDFEWGGPESWHEAVFKRTVTDLPTVISYVEALKVRAQAQTLALLKLKEAYETLRDLLLEAELDEPATPPARPMRMLRMAELLELVPYSKAHLGRLERVGKFPRRIHLGSARVVWDRGEVEEWLESKRHAEL